MSRGFRSQVLGVATAIGLVASSGVAHGVSLSLVSIGGPAMPQVEVRVAGLGNLAAPSLRTFDLDITFDPTFLSVASVSFGSFLGDPTAGPPTAIVGFGVAPPGVLDLSEVSTLTTPVLDASQPDVFTLATVTFTPLQDGNSALAITQNVLGDANGAAIAPTAATGVTVQSRIPALPGPGEPWVLLGFLGALGVAHRWRGFA